MRDDWYLAPYERALWSAGRHPVRLVGLVTGALAALVLAAAVGFLSSPTEGATVVDVVAGVVAVAFCVRAGALVLRWANETVVITSARVVMLSGILGRTVESVPLDRIERVTLRTSPSGRALGYADVIVELGPRTPATRFAHLRDPVRFYKVLIAAQTASSVLLPLAHPDHEPPAPVWIPAENLDTTELPPVVVR